MKRFQVPFHGVNICVCQGLTEYLDMHSLDMHSWTNEMLEGMLRAIRSCTCPNGQLIVSQTDYHDRVRYLEKGLSWYMRLRDRDELVSIVEHSGWRRLVCEREPMELITMCVARKSADVVRISGAHAHALSRWVKETKRMFCSLETDSSNRPNWRFSADGMP